MIQIQQLRLRPDHTQADLLDRVRKELRLEKDVPMEVTILRQSVDAHRRPDIFLVYTVEVSVRSEKTILSRCRKNPKVSRSERKPYRFPFAQKNGLPMEEMLRLEEKLPSEETRRPVIVGAGPAGLFAALLLARAGLRPVVVERGAPVEERMKDVEHFWKDGVLNPESNVQFGEGGAGTFSDGKLNTAIKDPAGRIRFVLETFVAFGADPEILYSYKPHIGSDVLTGVVRRMREEIEALGGKFLFHCRLDDLEREKAGRDRTDGTDRTGETDGKDRTDRTGETDGKDRADRTGETDGADRTDRADRSDETGGTDRTDRTDETAVWKLHLTRNASDASGEEHFTVRSSAVVLAIGHSARDTFEMLYRRKLRMTPKSFAVGLRIQHPQKMINDALYGEDCPYDLGPAPYKLTHRAEDGRGVYSFCMCPGGYVVNASSEAGRLAVNGMSNHDRGTENANSAIVVTVSPEDCREMAAEETAGKPDLFAGMYFQRMVERRAFLAAGGNVPVQRYADYCEDRTGTLEGSVVPVIRGDYAPANVRRVLPEKLSAVIEEGIEAFAGHIPGFNRPDALLCAVESRTSSPVRIERGDTLQADGLPGLFPCGEGAGYAGGITSAAVDGIRTAEAVCAMLTGGSFRVGFTDKK